MPDMVPDRVEWVSRQKQDADGMLECWNVKHMIVRLRVVDAGERG